MNPFGVIFLPLGGNFGGTVATWLTLWVENASSFAAIFMNQVMRYEIGPLLTSSCNAATEGSFCLCSSWNYAINPLSPV